MANEAPKSIHRLAIGTNVVLQIAFIGLIVMMLNYFSFNHYQRWDFSRDHKFTLSDQTKHILRNLDGKVHAIVYFSSSAKTTGAEVYADLASLMKECAFASKKKFIPEFVDPFKDFSRARELAAKYKFGNENLLILDYKGRTKFLSAADMALFDQRMMSLGRPAEYKAFRGEQAVTSALMELIEGKENKIYLLGGHGEPDLEGDVFKALRTFVERQNVKIGSLKLSGTGEIPADARALMLIGPKYDLSEREMQMLKAFWNQKGRIFVALDPTGRTPNLNAWLAELGIVPMDDRVLGVFKMPGVDALAVVRDVEAEFDPINPITKRLATATPTLPGSTQSLVLAEPSGGKIKVRPAIKAMSGYWGETKYNVDLNAGERVELGPEDHKDPILAASIEQGGVSDERVQVESSRMVVVGNSDFALTTAMVQLPANVDFTVAAVNWLLDRQELIGISPKERMSFVLNLDQATLGRLSLLAMVVMPIATVVLAMIVWSRRRA